MGKDKTHVNVVGTLLVVTVLDLRLTHRNRSHRPRRLRQVDHHWPLDLQVRWYRQAYDREVREGSC